MNKLSWEAIRPHLTKTNIIIFSAPVLLAVLLLSIDDSDEFSHIATADYAQLGLTKRCAAGAKEGEGGVIYGESTLDSNIKYNVRTPANYDATIAHPLLVVYAPAKANRSKFEKNSGLTYPATQAGYIIAYADHPALSSSSTIELGSIPKLMARKWCIDEGKVFLTGHSDGGSAAMALAFMTGSKHIPTAIAPSAAGIRHQDLVDRNCPEPISVLVMHSAKDRLFPDFGSESSGWWAACNQCGAIPDKLDNGCLAYTGCANDVQTWYCEGDKPHSQWPGMNETILDFFNRFNHRKL